MTEGRIREKKRKERETVQQTKISTTNSKHDCYGSPVSKNALKIKKLSESLTRQAR